MLNPAHILEIALLLLAAFLLGASIGSAARLAASRLIRSRAAAPSVATASALVAADVPVVAETPVLVAAPVIGEVVKTPTPTPPADVPAPDFTEALLALAGDKPGSLAAKIRMPSIAPLPDVAVTRAAGEMGPARVAGETTSGRPVPHPRSADEPLRVVAATGASAEVIPFPLEKVAVESAEVPVAVVAVEPITEIEVPDLVAPVEATTTVEPDASIEVGETVGASPEVEDEAAPVVETDAVASAGSHPSAEMAVADLPAAAVEPVESETLPAAPQHEPAPVVAPASSNEDDEAAAMRAIEGNWSPRRSALPRGRKAALPEMAADDDVAASSAAVASAVEAVSTAETDEAPGKPAGIPAPRRGVKDDLTHVIGILPIIETALNTLGLYHFDQIAELTDQNASWIETHLGIAGRIGREHWREQARELALATADTRKAAGQQ